jgi:hypothetical protein
MQDTLWSAGLMPRRTGVGYFLNDTLRFGTRGAFLDLDSVKRFRASFDPSLEKNGGCSIRFYLIRQSSAVPIVCFNQPKQVPAQTSSKLSNLKQPGRILEIFERATMTRIGRC